MKNERLLATSLTTALTTVLAVSLAGPAMAGSFDTPAAEPQVAPIQTQAPSMPQEPATNWTGGWVGGSVGVGATNYNIAGDVMDPRDGDMSFELPNLGGEGFTGSLQAGYGYQIGDNLVIGAQLDYTASNIDTTASLSMSAPNGGSVSGDYQLRAQHMFSGTVRAGYLPSASTQVYGLAGVTRGSFEGDLSLPSNAPQQSYDYNLNGLTLGTGVETMVSDSVSMSLEYRYTRFEDDSLFSDANSDIDLETSLHSARVGVNLRF